MPPFRQAYEISRSYSKGRGERVSPVVCQVWHATQYLLGYDDEGAAQLDRRLVDTNKWIGTSGT